MSVLCCSQNRNRIIASDGVTISRLPNGLRSGPRVTSMSGLAFPQGRGLPVENRVHIHTLTKTAANGFRSLGTGSLPFPRVVGSTFPELNRLTGNTALTTERALFCS